MTLKQEREKLELLPFQKLGVSIMVNSPARKFYLADEMGLGKTVQALSYANEIGAYRVLICCPASLRLNWAREADLWFKLGKKNTFAKAILSSKGFRELQKNALIHRGYLPSPLIVSYDLLVINSAFRKYCLDRTWDLVIADEVNECRGVDSQRAWVMDHLFRENENVLFMSGTPIENSAMDIYIPLKNMMLAPEVKSFYKPHETSLISDIDTFARRFTFVKKTRYGTRFIGIRNALELKGLLRRPIPNYLRRLLSSPEVKLDLPKVTYNRIDLDLKVKLSVDDQELESFLTQFKKDEKYAVNSKEFILNRIWRELGDAISSHPDSYYVPEQLLKSGRSLVLFAWHKNVVQNIKTALHKYSPRLVVGDTSPADKQKNVDALQNGDCQLLICNIKAGGVGYTMTKASDVMFFEIYWLSTRILQAIKRLDRIGQKNPVTAHFLVAKNTFHQKLIKMMIQKQTLIDKVI